MDWSFLSDMRPFDFESAYRVISSNRNIFWSWGPEFFQKLKEGRTPKGMSFKVNGHHFQGLVVLTVNGLDYYEIRLVKDGEIVETIKDVCVFDLVNTIDEKIEKLPSYTR